MLELINEGQLHDWMRGNLEAAKGLLVELVYRLVAASCPNPRDRRFPLPDSIGQHGPDGFLEDDVGFLPFVPEGVSYWQFGTNSRPAAKATDDYKALTEPGGVPENTRLNSTFVFVTPLSAWKEWEYTWKPDAQAEWVDKYRGKGEWKDVKVIDGTKLIDWIHQFPAIELWLAHRTHGLPLDGIDIPGLHWMNLKSIGEPPPLTPEVFLTNRDEACARIDAILNEEIRQVRLATHFPEQVVDFISAYLASTEGEKRIEVIGRCLVVSSVEAWNAICALKQRHILIVDVGLDLNDETGVRLIQKARRAGHSIIFGAPPGGVFDPSSVVLRMPRSHQLEESLTKAGYGRERARILANKCNGNLGSLLRCLQNMSLLPEWAEGTTAAELSIAALLGAWIDTNEADRTAIDSLVGNAYGEWIKLMHDITHRRSAPLQFREGQWRFITRYEGWFALGPQLLDSQINRIVKVVVPVLQETDPQFELPPSDRFAANIHGKVMSHSHSLRTGLAECLALLGSYPKALINCSPGRPEEAAAAAVRQILVDANWLQWASLNDVAPLLAEAAPREFLAAVEEALQRDPSPFVDVFAQEGDGLSGNNYMTGVLWGLETLAWSEHYLGRVAGCLGALAAMDPGGKWGNRPANSLETILLPWHPQTCCVPEKRTGVIKMLVATFPEVGWKLLLALLPQSHSLTIGTRRPAWRSWIPDDWDGSVSEGEFQEQVAAIADIAIDMGQASVSRLPELISNLHRLPTLQVERLLGYLESDSVSSLPDAVKLQIWNAISDTLAQHTRHPDADWSIEASKVGRMSTILTQLAPKSPLLRFQRLFANSDFDLYEEGLDFAAQHQELEIRRKTAIEEIVAHGGVTSVLSFAKSVESPSRVGAALGMLALKSFDTEILPATLESSELSFRQLAASYVWYRFGNCGWDWIDGLGISTWKPSEVGQFLAFLPFNAKTWELAQQLLGPNEAEYWNKTAANPYGTNDNLELAVKKLLEHGRKRAAICCVRRMLDQNQNFDVSLAVTALLANSSEQGITLDVHDITEIIKVLQKNHDVDEGDMLKVEMAYLRLLNKHNGASPLILARNLATRPSFFCEAIRLVYRSEFDQNAAYPNKDIALQVYNLLQEWRLPPGSVEGEDYDGEQLCSWLDAVKEECIASGHLQAALSTVGHVLAYAPPDPDGLWIHRSAAEVLNSKDAESMRDGLRTELFNSRGVHWVDPSGAPERALSAKYQARAESAEARGYFRLAVPMRELAERYEREAEKISSRQDFGA